MCMNNHSMYNKILETTMKCYNNNINSDIYKIIIITLLIIISKTAIIEAFTIQRQQQQTSLAQSPIQQQQHIQQQQQSKDEIQELYNIARQYRIQNNNGDSYVAQSIYEKIILQYNPYDRTTSTRIGLHSKSNNNIKLQNAFDYIINHYNNHSNDTNTQQNKEIQDIQSLRDWLYTMNYTSKHIHDEITKNSPHHHQQQQHKNMIAPITIKPASAGTIQSYNFPFRSNQNNHNNDANASSSSASSLSILQILISLFLFGLCININDDLPSPFEQQQQLDNNNTNHNDTIQYYINLLIQYGFVCYCTYNPNLIYSIVSIIPIDFNNNHNHNHNNNTYHNSTTVSSSLYMITDWHPNVLNQIHISDYEDAVMYIGPDSLALIQHYTLSILLKQQQESILSSSSSLTCNNNNNMTKSTTVLDICSGSGVQALSYLMISNIIKNSLPSNNNNTITNIVCIDKNTRALRFCYMNAIFNGFIHINTMNVSSSSISKSKVYPSNDNNNNKYTITLIEGDVVNNTGRIYSYYDNTGRNHYNHVYHTSNNHNHQYQPLIPLLQSLHEQYDIILANPPFVPVPSSSSSLQLPNQNISSNNNNSINNNNIIQQRYGLFSSGGPSGEIVLASILKLSNLLFNSNSNNSKNYNTNGIVAIVSEFFFRSNHSNHDTNYSNNKNDEIARLLQQLESYWMEGNQNSSYSCKAMLLTNEIPISATTYAYRRADTDNEIPIWINHLNQENIISCSPGLLFIQNQKLYTTTTNGTKETIPSNQWVHYHVPKTELGSIWTPSNTDAIQFTQEKYREFFHL